MSQMLALVDSVAPAAQAEPAQNGPASRDASNEPPDEPFSWLQPHPTFAIVLVGPEETPFGIQKDFLCSKSAFYRRKFNDESDPETMECLVRLPDTPVVVFSFAQNFLYTGQVSPDVESLPPYDVLVGVWKLGHDLGVEGLCDATLDAMREYRRITEVIPATPLLVQVWKDTPEGSSIRQLLLSWAAAYMRSSDSRAEFARSLPQEVLSELVVAMSSLDSPPAAPSQAGFSPTATAAAATALVNQQEQQQQRKHHLDIADQADLDATGTNENSDLVPAPKKQRRSDGFPTINGTTPSSAPVASARGASSSHKNPKSRTCAPAAPKSTSSAGGGSSRRKSGGAAVDDGVFQYSSDLKLNFCNDLLSRMLSGPGFWTRLVGPFKEPVNPEIDGVPDYLDKIKYPMDLSTMKVKMDRRGYANETEFLADMEQIFANCYTYCSRKDNMYAMGERFEKTFREKFGQMNKWIHKLSGEELT